MTADPFCLKCGNALTLTPSLEWGDRDTESTDCERGGKHQVRLPGADD